jgi:hypothetical protein
MARATTTTWLALDDWARIMGYNLYHFNGIEVDSCQVGESCTNIWYQSPEQHDTVSREELALAIQNAELIISSWVGYNLMPDWNKDKLPTRNHYDSLTRTPFTGSGRPKSIQVKRRHVLAAGVKRKEPVYLDVETVFVDKDGDGFRETVQVYADLSGYNTDEIRVFYPLEDGSEEWEIRPITVYSDRIEFPVYLAVHRQLIEQICPDPLEGRDEEIYLKEVDIYRVYNDTDVQATLIYEPSPSCNPTCQETTIGNCVYVRDNELGEVVYNPRLLTEPDIVELYYYSGYTGSGIRPYTNLDTYWRYPVAYLAASLLDREPRNCCGGNESFLVSQWKEDVSKSDEKKKVSYFATQRQIENQFGISTKGAWYAYLRATAKKLV